MDDQAAGPSPRPLLTRVRGRSHPAVSFRMTSTTGRTRLSHSVRNSSPTKYPFGPSRRHAELVGTDQEIGTSASDIVTAHRDTSVRLGRDGLRSRCARRLRPTRSTDTSATV